MNMSDGTDFIDSNNKYQENKVINDNNMKMMNNNDIKQEKILPEFIMVTLKSSKYITEKSKKKYICEINHNHNFKLII